MSKNAILWRQVDAARILACLQGDYEQSFYSDLDVTNLIIDSDEIQEKINKHGLIAGGVVQNSHLYFENGSFGFSKRKRNFFWNLYCTTQEEARVEKQNGYRSYLNAINSLGINISEIFFKMKFLPQESYSEE